MYWEETLRPGDTEIRPVNPPNIIDIEASGFGPDSYPIEVGVAMSSGETFCSLVLPEPEWTYWDEKAEAIHRVPRDLLEAYGKPITEVAEALNSLLETETVYSDGWQVDKAWMTTLFFKAGVDQRFSLSMLEMILTEEQMNVWHAAKDEVIQEMGVKRHSLDAVVVQQTFEKTR